MKHWSKEKHKLQQNFFWAVTRNNTPNNKIRLPNRNGQNTIDNLLKLYNTQYLPKRKKNKHRRDFLRVRKSNMETPQNHKEKLIQLKQDYNNSNHGIKLVMS